MRLNSLLKDTRKISLFAMITFFMALIRCISEPFRLQNFSTKVLTLFEIKPYLLGALVASLALLIMTILFYFNKSKIIIALGVLTVIILLIIKGIYLT